MRVLVALSGGVDSSVAAARLVEEGHEVVGATMKLWGGDSDSGCCSVADVVDARRVADELDIAHHVFDFTEDFEEHVVAPYVRAHATGRTPNPCAECNRHLKFDRLLARARRLGFDAIATGHHARLERSGGRLALCRGRDVAKDQSYVLAMLTAAELEHVLLPVGVLTKQEVRAQARALGLRTADKAESQDVCFIASNSGGRARFLSERIELHAGTLVDAHSGETVGDVAALELVTVGQRRGLRLGPRPGAGGSSEPQFALEVDVTTHTVTVGTATDLLGRSLRLEERTWTAAPLACGDEVLVQTSAHGEARPGRLDDHGVVLDRPARVTAPGQLVALYVGEEVVGSGVVARRNERA